MPLPIRVFNPLASSVLNGISSITAQYEDEYFVKKYDVQLTTLQTLNNQLVQFDSGSDIFWTAFSVSSDGPVAVRFSDASGYYLSDQFIGAFPMNSQPGTPYVMTVNWGLPPGSAIYVDLREQSAQPLNNVLFLFHYLKRFGN